MSDLFFPCPHAGATRRKPVSVFPLPATPFPGRCSHAALVRPAHFHEAARGAGHGHKARTTAIQRIYCRAKTLLFSKNRQFFCFYRQNTTFFFANFGADFRKVVRHKRTKSVIELVLLIEFSQNWIWSRMGSNNAHATDIYYPQRENYILAWREWLLLIHSIRQCEKPDKRISKIQSSRFSHKIT